MAEIVQVRKETTLSEYECMKKIKLFNVSPAKFDFTCDPSHILFLIYRMKNSKRSKRLERISSTKSKDTQKS